VPYRDINLSRRSLTCLLRTVINFVCLQDVAECRSRLVVRAVGSAEAKFVIGRMSYLLTFGHVASSTFCC